MSLYAGADEAEVLGARRKLHEYPGSYSFEVVEVADGLAEGDGQPFYSVDFKVLESTNPDLRAGAHVTWTCKQHAAKAYRRYFLSDIKKFLGALTKHSPEDIGVESIESSVSEGQPCAGLTVGAEVFEKKSTKEEDKTFITTRFFSL